MAGDTLRVPFGAPPVSNPVPVQLVALALPHSRSLEPPSAIVSGVAVSEAVTAPPTVTVAVAGALIAPPSPAQSSWYVAVTLGETASVPPSIDCAPLQSGSWTLLAVQLVAFALPHVRALAPPRAIASGDADNEAMTAPVTVTVTEAGALVAPPAPAQLSV
jgi:hypothetical protein